MPLVLDARNSVAGTVHGSTICGILVDGVVFRRQERRLRETAALMIWCRLRCLGAQGVERELWRSSRSIARELGLTQSRVFEVLVD